jgi:hypothetical protein
VPPDAIRIEDEVWQEAFARREPSASRAARRLRALEGGLADTPATRQRRPARPAHASRPAPAALPAEPAARPVAPATPAGTAAAIATQSPGAGIAGRRTVTIRGRGAERNLPWADATRRRPPRRAYERAGFKPDRVAMWAVLLGLLLVLVAVMSAHG